MAEPNRGATNTRVHRPESWRCVRGDTGDITPPPPTAPSSRSSQPPGLSPLTAYWPLTGGTSRPVWAHPYPSSVPPICRPAPKDQH